MKTVIVASNNPVKIQAARQGFARVFPGETFTFQGVSVPSGISDQPMSSAETLQGAANRARNARNVHPDADFWIGIEGGCDMATPIGAEDSPLTELAVFAWVFVLTSERIGRGQTGVFFLPPRVAELVHQGIELGEADDIVFGRTNSKQSNGAVGLLTGDLIDRTEYYVHAVILALIPFKNPELYPAG